MATVRTGLLAQRLRALATGRDGGGPGDGELLGRFVARRDEEAFAALVRRHGPTVLGVARRSLRDAADVDDVFQATFLVLARRAGSIRCGDALGSWLYGVTLRLARRTRADAARRQTVERATARGPGRPCAAADPAAEVTLREARALLDRELDRLPVKYQAPLVLCCLEGLTRDEAAQRLGWPVGLVKSRLEQARERLHRRLARYGLTLTGMLTADLLTAGRARALSRALATTTARAARQFVSAGTGDGLSRGAVALAGRGPSLAVRTLWAAAAGLTLTLSLAVGAGLLTAPPPASAKGQPETGTKAAPRTDRAGDPLPAGVLTRFGTVRYRGEGFNCAALSPDGKVLATAGAEIVTLWDLATGLPRFRLRGTSVPTDFSPNQTFLAFSPDGKRLATLGGYEAPPWKKADPMACVWDTATGERLARFDPTGGTKIDYRLPARFLWFTPDGKAIGIALHDGVFRFADAATGREVGRFDSAECFRDECPGIAVSPDGRLVTRFDGGRGNTIAIVDPVAGKEVRRIFGPATFENVAFSPDSSLLAAADDAAKLHLYEVRTGKELATVAAKDVPRMPEVPIGLTALAFGPDGQTVYAGDQEGTIHRWRLRSEGELPALSHGAVHLAGAITNWVTGLYLPPDGRTLVAAGWGDGVIRRWDVAAGKLPAGPAGFSGELLARRSPDGRLVAIGDHAGRLEVQDARDAALIRVLTPAGQAVREVCWSPDGNTLAVGRWDQSVALWDVAAGREIRTLDLSDRLARRGSAVGVDGLAFSPDGKQLLVSRFGRGTNLVAVATGESVWHMPAWGHAAFSADGKTFTLAGDEGSLRTFTSLIVGDAKAGVVRSSVRFPSTVGLPDCVCNVALAPDGRLLATTHGDGSIRLRDPEAGHEHTRLPDTGDSLARSCLAFSPDGKWLLSGRDDLQVRVWEVATGQRVFVFTGHTAGVNAVEVSPLDWTALSSSHDATALRWTLRPPAPTGPAVPPVVLWDALGREDAAAAYRAVWALADNPTEAVPLLRKRLPAERSTVNSDILRKLLADLNADAFAVREKATRELTDLGPAATPLLQKALDAADSEEARKRLRGILDALERPPGREEFRRLRAVQVLELAATPEARALLKEWAAGLPHALLTDDAAAALQRLDRADKARSAPASKIAK